MNKAINLKELLFFYFILTLGFFLYTTKVLWWIFYNRGNLQVISKRTTINKENQIIRRILEENPQV